MPPGKASRSPVRRLSARRLLRGEGEGNVHQPYLFFPLFAGDVGRPVGRQQRSEFVNRTPAAVTNFSTAGITLLLQNSGNVASDLVLIEFQLIYCTDPRHGALDGFTLNHAAESSFLASEATDTLDFVAAGAAVVKRINFGQPPVSHLANLYFRARVSTLWDTAVPPTAWSFGREPWVTEAYYRVP